MIKVLCLVAVHEQNGSIKGDSNFMKLCITKMEAKRHRVSALIDANIPTMEICRLENCSRVLVAKVRKLKESNSSLARKPGSGGHNSIRTEEFLLALHQTIEADPSTSKSQLAAALGVSRTTVKEATRELGLHSYRRRRRQFLSNRTKDIRVEKGRKLLAWVTANGSTVQIFSDKKLWTVEQARNAQNDRFLATCSKDVPPILSQKHPASAMMMGVITSDGKKMPPLWFPQGLKINKEVYINAMETVVKPWINATYPNGGYVWQQDSAPAHMSKKCQKWCKANLAAFWPWTMWPPSSPDLSPMDYAVWGELNRKVCSITQPSVEALKAAVEREWAAMSPEFIISSCRAFIPRINKMLHVAGGHFET